MNARNLRLKLEPLYRNIAEAKQLDEFSLLAILSEIEKIRIQARSEGFDPSNVDRPLAISAIENMDSANYLTHYRHIYFYCPYLNIRSDTFSRFKMTDALANDYLELCLMQVDQVHNADGLNEVISAADRLYLSDHHDLYIAYLDYICESFDFRLPEVVDFFERENKGSCASSLSMSLSIIHHIIANDDYFMSKHREFWDRYTTFLANYFSKLQVNISAKAIDVYNATIKCKRLIYGDLANYLVVMAHNENNNFASFINTDLWENEAACKNFISYNPKETALSLFIRLTLSGRINSFIDESIVSIIAENPTLYSGNGEIYITAADVTASSAGFLSLVNNIKSNGSHEVISAFIKMLINGGIDKGIIIKELGSRHMLEQDMGF
jgi:hypothetical protein